MCVAKHGRIQYFSKLKIICNVFAPKLQYGGSTPETGARVTKIVNQ